MKHSKLLAWPYILSDDTFRGVATYLIANAVYIVDIAIIDTILTYLVLGLFFAFINLGLESIWGLSFTIIFYARN